MMKTTAIAVNQPAPFFMIVPGPRNPSLGFAVAITHLQEIDDRNLSFASRGSLGQALPET
jgi:hypothetical protein